MNQSQSSDWLREYRIQLGLSADPVAHQRLSFLLLKGTLLAGLWILIPVAVIVALGIQKHNLQLDVEKLAVVESRVGDAKARLQSMEKQRSELTAQTRRIASQLVAVRSGSALLEQLRQVTPQGVRLLSVQVFPSKLTIKGEAIGGDAYERINALALNIEALAEFLDDGTTVVKATANDRGLVEFSLNSGLDPSVRTTPKRLRALGSEGLAQRYELIEAEGIEL